PEPFYYGPDLPRPLSRAEEKDGTGDHDQRAGRPDPGRTPAARRPRGGARPQDPGQRVRAPVDPVRPGGHARPPAAGRPLPRHFAFVSARKDEAAGDQGAA